MPEPSSITTSASAPPTDVSLPPPAYPTESPEASNRRVAAALSARSAENNSVTPVQATLTAAERSPTGAQSMRCGS